MRVVATLLLAGLLAAGCASQARIPDGSYVAPDVGTLVVRDKFVQFDMPVDDAHTQRTKGTYEYELGSDGSIRFFGSSNDAYFLFAVVFPGEWHWARGAIERRRLREGVTIRFEPIAAH